MSTQWGYGSWGDGTWGDFNTGGVWQPNPTTRYTHPLYIRNRWKR